MRSRRLIPRELRQSSMADLVDLHRAIVAGQSFQVQRAAAKCASWGMWTRALLASTYALAALQ